MMFIDLKSNMPGLEGLIGKFSLKWVIFRVCVYLPEGMYVITI
jgi:hypothetical protein